MSPSAERRPALPAAAKSNNATGAEAFVDYWFESITYAMKTGDTSDADAVAHAQCEACKNLRKSIHHIYEAGNRNTGGGWIVSRILFDPSSRQPDYRFRVRVVQPAQKLIGKDGAVLDSDKREVLIFIAGATWDEDRFLLYGLQNVS